MDSDHDFEPQVGEIRAVRTFRVGPGGMLFPLFSKKPWVDGANDAVCNAGEKPSGHACPDPDCTCGLYAFADLAAASEYPFTRHVLAVVTCWGRIIVGTRGLRTQHARIEALWLSPAVPADLAQSTAAHYPAATMFADRDEMLAAFAPTVLADYELEHPAGTKWHRIGARVAVGAALIAGLLPMRSIAALPYGTASFFTLLAALLAFALVPRHNGADAVVHRQRLICLALALWMCAPLAGTAGVLFLRLPLLQISALMWVQKAGLNRMARTFPARIV